MISKQYFHPSPFFPCYVQVNCKNQRLSINLGILLHGHNKYLCKICVPHRILWVPHSVILSTRYYTENYVDDDMYIRNANARFASPPKNLKIIHKVFFGSRSNVETYVDDVMCIVNTDGFI